MRGTAIGFLTLMLAHAAMAGESKVHGMDRSTDLAQQALAGGMNCAKNPGGLPGLGCIAYNRSMTLWGDATLKGAIVTHVVSSPQDLTDFILCDAVDYLLAGWKDGWQWTLAATRRSIATGETSKTTVGDFSVTISHRREADGHAYKVEIIREPTL